MPVKKTKSAVADKSKRGKTKKTTAQNKSTRNKIDKADNEKIFALDIGTRSVIGIVAEKEPSGLLKIIATRREEHKTRAMLDGQIHDVPKVAEVIEKVRDELVEEVGEDLKSVAVAAAGRALYTMTADAEMEIHGAITLEIQNNLEFAGVQLAQAKLAESNTIPKQTSYYCVGFSVINYELDGIQLKSLVGQRGKMAKAKVIATFLPRQVIDSMQIALSSCDLEMRALTLEPIAAINVLIPPTMRHLNLVLVDIGAGTSDIAITKNGSVIAYGMVPIAGDEITEALSQKFLLDFNIAEEIKRRAANGETSTFTDILGTTHELTAEEIISAVNDSITHLAAEIAQTILELNGNDIPQAVMLVGGGSLTPNLQKYVAAALNMPELRVGVRKPDIVDGITSIPKELCMPDAVTPLGILKIASINNLHFLTVYINDDEYALFHFQQLTIRDALLNAGIQLRKFNGKPGLALMVTVDGDRKFFPGSMGTFATLKMNGKDAELETPLEDRCKIKIERGADGEPPLLKISDVVPELPSFTVKINGEIFKITAKVIINGEAALPDQILADGDDIKLSLASTIGEVLRIAGYSPTDFKLHYQLNGRDLRYTCTPKILMNDVEAKISLPVHDGDSIEYIANDNPRVSDVLNLSGVNSSIKIYYSGEEYEVPTVSNIDLTVNNRPANMSTLIIDGAKINYRKSAKQVATVSDALLAVDFKPPPTDSRMSFEIKVNGVHADFAEPMKNGDTLEVILKSPDGTVISTANSIEIPAKLSDMPTNQVNSREPKLRRRLTIQDFIRND